MTKKYQDVIKILEKEGFPFERKIRRELLKHGIETVQSRYFTQSDLGGASKDIDVLGNIHFRTYNSKDKKSSLNLHLRIVGEVKRLSGSKICFYELDNEKPGNFQLRFPNLLSNCYRFENYCGGEIVLSNFIKIFGKIPFSKTVTCLILKGKSKYESKGNSPVYGISNNLALACEYLHRKEYLNYQDNLKIHACFPIVFTDAEILKIKGINRLRASKVNLFMCLIACADLDKVPITAKEKYYLPVLIVTKRGIKKAVEIVKKISKDLSSDVEKLIKKPNLLQKEYEDYKKISMYSPKNDIVKLLEKCHI